VTSPADLLFDADRPATEPFVHWRDTTYTRGEIATAAQRLADTLRGMGAAPDSAVAAWVPSTPLGLVMCFGIWRVGAVLAPLAAARPAGPDDGGPGLEPMTDPAFDALVADVRPSVVVRPSLDDESLVPQLTVRPGEARHYADGITLVETVPTATGPARRLLHGAAGVAAAVASATGTLRDVPVHLVTVPLASGAGLDAALVAAATGGAIGLLEGCTPEELAEAVRRLRVEAAMVTADLADALVADAGLSTLMPLRYLRCVDRPLSAEEARRLRSRFGVTGLAGFARPELGGEVIGWTAGDAAGRGDAKLGSVGRPYAGVEIRVVRSDRTEAAPGEQGEIRARSPFAAVGALSDRLGVGVAVDDRGFVRTGAWGWVDVDGFVWVEPAPGGGADGPAG